MKIHSNMKISKLTLSSRNLTETKSSLRSSSTGGKFYMTQNLKIIDNLKLSQNFLRPPVVHISSRTSQTGGEKRTQSVVNLKIKTSELEEPHTGDILSPEHAESSPTPKIKSKKLKSLLSQSFFDMSSKKVGETESDKSL